MTTMSAYALPPAERPRKPSPPSKPSTPSRFLASGLLALLLPSAAMAADEIHWTMISPTAVTFDWRGTGRTLRYGLTTTYGSTATGQTPSILPFSSAGPFWEAKLTGLQAGKTYHYSLDGGADHKFHALPGPGSTFTVFAEADMGSSAYATMAPVQSLIAGGTPSFVLGIGDLTYADSFGAAAVDRHFNDVMVWSLDAAYMPIWGNHDWGDTTDDLRNYKGRFDLPNPQTSPGSPAVSCCGEDWYWFDAGNVRFISYPEPFSGAWSAWRTAATTLMDQAQGNAAILYIVTFGHRPAFSSGYHAGDSGLKAILDSLGVHHAKYVLNLNGHSHNYERSKPQFGVTHITLGIGGSTLETVSGTCKWGGGCPPPSWSAYRAFHHGALRLTFDASSIHGDVLCGPSASQDDIACSAGGTFDSFSIDGQSVTATPPAAPSGLAVDAVRPDPAGATFTLDYSLADGGEARLELLDVAGRSLSRIALGDPGPGRHEALILSPPGAPPGVYWLRLTQSGQVARRRVVLMP
jgi:hypothetical protein